MNCCNHDCNQGRNCPARLAKVAKIGRKDYAREELPPVTWRGQMKSLAYWVVLALLGWLIWLPMLYLAFRL